jgi:hypothetical protein
MRNLGANELDSTAEESHISLLSGPCKFQRKIYSLNHSEPRRRTTMTSGGTDSWHPSIRVNLGKTIPLFSLTANYDSPEEAYSTIADNVFIRNYCI